MAIASAIRHIRAVYLAMINRSGDISGLKNLWQKLLSTSRQPASEAVNDHRYRLRKVSKHRCSHKQGRAHGSKLKQLIHFIQGNGSGPGLWIYSTTTSPGLYMFSSAFI
jgi:hypothetical protein